MTCSIDRDVTYFVWTRYLPQSLLLVAAESMGSLMEAAGRLQVGVFASGPLQEAALLQHSALKVSCATGRQHHLICGKTYERI